MKKFLNSILKRDLDFLAALSLTILDSAVKPLTYGPDRLIHDPAVNRILDPGYLQNDWYTQMATDSGIYYFYARLVGLYKSLGINEEQWRLFLYILFITLLYYSIIKIIRQIVNKPIIPVITIVIIHALFNSGINQPVWLYGPFIHIDGGLAPRTIGMSLSFLGLLFLITSKPYLSAAALGIAALFHPSNSLVLYLIIFGAWTIKSLIYKASIGKIITVIAQTIVVFIAAGGWFVLKVALGSWRGADHFSSEKYIWIWTYFRAPYLVLPEVTSYWWRLFVINILFTLFSWASIRNLLLEKNREAYLLVTITGLSAVIYFFAYYYFAFINPWLPGFKLYSIRGIYLLYFASFVNAGIAAYCIYEMLINKLPLIVKLDKYRVISFKIIFTLTAASILSLYSGGSNLIVNSLENISRSYSTATLVKAGLPDTEIYNTLSTISDPILTPPNFNTYGVYIPTVVSFKSFGFTDSGLIEWYSRINSLVNDELENTYNFQLREGSFKSVSINFQERYSELTNDEVAALSVKYDFKYFLTFSGLQYNFKVISKDRKYTIYEVTPNKVME